MVVVVMFILVVLSLSKVQVKTIVIIHDCELA